MEKLSELLNTRYIYDDFIHEFNEVCETHSELDLAGCKFTPNAERILKSHYGRVYFIDSEDEEFNKLLLHNNLSKTARLDNVKILPMEFNTVDDLLEIFRKLDKTGHYRVDESYGNQVKRVVVIVMLTMMFPDMVLDVGINLKDVYEFARKEWLKVSKHHDEYNYVDGQSLINVKVHNDGKVYLINGNVLKESAFVHMYPAMPIDFGSKVIVKDEEYSMIFNSCLRILDSKTESEKHMYDFLERIE